MNENEFDQNEIDIDKIFAEQLSIEPLTDGLGFKHSEPIEEKLEMPLREKSALLKEQLIQKSHQIKEEKKEAPMDMGELAPFYGQDKSEVKSESTFKTEELYYDYENADVGLRMIAYSIDLLTIGAMYLCSISIMLLANQVTFSNLPLRELVTLTAPVLALFYLFYFSILDKTSFSTLGKRFMGLRLLNATDKSPSMLQALLRSIISLLSIATMGLGGLLDFQGKLSETHVVKK